MCCKDCTERYLGCHSACNDYIEFKSKKEAFNLARKKYLENSRWTDVHLKNNRKKRLSYRR